MNVSVIISCRLVKSKRNTFIYAHHLNNNVRRKRSSEKENKNQNMLYVDQVVNQSMLASSSDLKS